MITSSFRYGRFTARLKPFDGVIRDIYGSNDSDLEIYDPISHQSILKEAVASRIRALEGAITRFRDCGVTLDRMTIEEHPGESVLCVDGGRRFSWRLVCHIR